MFWSRSQLGHAIKWFAISEVTPPLGVFHASFWKHGLS